MIDWLKKVYHRYSETWLVRLFGKIYRNGFFVSNYMAYLRMKRLSEKKTSGDKPAEILFLCQYPPAWNKMKSIFEMMLKDDRFNVKILAVPDNINKPDDKVYEFFSGIYGRDIVINAYKNGTWYNIKQLMPDYVFYQRPYDQYLPKSYRSGVVSWYTKICYLVYGYTMIEALKEICDNKLFYRNVYIFFAENTISRDDNIKRFKISHNKGYRKTLNIGYPVLEYFVRHKTDEKAENDKFKVLWTPRWSDDKEAGGSNFITYKDKIITLVNDNTDLNVVFRPHPMTFDHFISVGKLTQEDVDSYLKLYDENDSLEYNNTAEYVDVFWNTDVLLSDLSSVMVEYFVTGKPIIYCDTGAKPDEFFEELLKAMYVTNTWEQAREKLLELKMGIDPLKEEREKKIKELLGDDFLHISERFLEAIYDDYSS